MITDINYSETLQKVFERTKFTTSCWEWTGGVTGAGYGNICKRINGKKVNLLVHRVSYIALKGPIPTNLVIDHLCSNRVCVNPKHLEAVTLGVNTLRSENNIPTINKNKKYCVNGHPFDSSNTYVRKVNYGCGIQRGCKICRRNATRKHRIIKEES